MKPTYLLDSRKNICSQFGEDGILEKILEILPNESNPWCVEFGAWDGKFCMNTNNLICNKGFCGVMIEGDKNKIPDLKKTFKDYEDKVYIFHRWIDFEENSLDNVLSETPIPQNFTLLSIDIDGEDYYVWESLKNYDPKIVIIEFNQTIPSNLSIVQEKGAGNHFGASALATCELAEQKGYELVSATDCNLIFVKKEYFPLFKIDDNSLLTLYKPFEEKYVTQVFQGYNSEFFISGNDRIFWSTVELSIEKEDFQVLPHFLRYFPASVSKLHRAFSKLYINIFKRKNIT